ncbi:MAG: TPM domain-containing protein [Blastocatellia bacterium]
MTVLEIMVRALKLSLTSAAILVLLGSVAVADPQLPQPQGMLSDFAGKVSPATRQQIETLLRNFRERSGVEVAVVTIPFDDMQGYPIEDYTLRLGRQWGVGRDSEKRALLLLVAIKEADGQGGYHGATRLEVSRHLEGDVPDMLAGELIRKMRVDFMAGRFDQALTTGTQTILATLAQRLGISMDGIDATQAARQPVRQPVRGTGRRGGGIPVFAIIIIIFVLVAVIRGLFGGRGGGGGRRGGMGSDWLLWAILFGSGGGRGGWGGFSGGGDSSWGGGGDSGGDFGGFGGGGDFGGGGASDSW